MNTTGNTSTTNPPNEASIFNAARKIEPASERVLLAAIAAAFGYDDEYLKASPLLLGFGCMVTIEKAALGGSGFVLVIVSLFIVL